MMSTKTYIPEHYAPLLNLYDTQKAIGLLKRVFEDTLCGSLHLRRVSAPLFVEASSGLNDDLNGVERPVSFDIPAAGREAQVVHSLAKWKRMALYHYHFPVGEGLVTDMNAIRRDEIPDNLHSIYVDQWDWEKVIAPRDRNLDYLKHTVEAIVCAMADTQKTLRSVFPQLSVLPQVHKTVSFVTTQELEDTFPHLTAKEREDAWVKDHPTTFLIGIGGALQSGKPHDGRAPDYDDWTLHGHPGGRRRPGPAAENRRLRQPPGTHLPQAAAGGQAPPHHRRRHRPVPSVHVPVGQGPHWRGPGVHLGRRDHPDLP